MTVAGLRSSRIDFLRGVAICSVLLLHFSLTYDLIQSPLATVLPGWLLQGLILNGNYGVTLFFVISGFLITSNNLARYGHLRDVDLKQFYALRFARIIPPLLLALALIVPLDAAGVPSFCNNAQTQHLLVISVISVLTFWHNVLMGYVGYFNYCLNIYWSLSVEEVFYLAFPLACCLLRRERLIVGLCCLLMLIAPLYRHAHADDEIFYLYGNLACFDGIAVGCLTWPARMVCVMGRHSYELYLFHGIVLAGLRNVIPKGTMPYGDKLPSFVLFVVLTALLTSLIARYFAEPLNARLRRALVTRRPAVA